VIPFRRWPFLGLMVFPGQAMPDAFSNSRASSLFEFRLPPESFPVSPSRPDCRNSPPTTLLGFVSLQHIQGSGIHLPRVCLARYGPPPGFGYPLDGLRPPGPRRPCFVPTALLGFRPSEPSPPGRYLGRSHLRRTHLPFRLPLLPRTNPQAGPANLGSWVLTLPRVPRPPWRG
jgi:hypothetical protein